MDLQPVLAGKGAQRLGLGRIAYARDHLVARGQVLAGELEAEPAVRAGDQEGAHGQPAAFALFGWGRTKTHSPSLEAALSNR